MSTTVQSATDIRPFHVDVPEEKLTDLRRRVAATRWPQRELVDDQSQGVQSALMEALTRYWVADYDWRKCEAELNALPQFKTEIDGLDLYFIHVKSPHEHALPLIMTHGWPGSVIEMLEVVGPLVEPTAHGGRAEDAFDVVLPSLPGYGFSDAPLEVGWDQNRTAKAWAELMNRLGYTHYVAQGGDQGASVTDAMGRMAPDGLVGVHFNFLSSFPTDVLAAVFGGGAAHGLFKRLAVATLAAHAERTELTALEGVEAIFKRGYIVEMPEHPQTVGFALTDSPVGLAAWMLDHDADSYEKISHAFIDGKTTGGLTRDRVLDNITLYWLTNTATSSARIYWEEGRGIAAAIASGQKPPKLSLPVAFTVFPDELFEAPRKWAEKVYPNLIYFNEVDKGGHFAAWEEPALFASELREAFRSLR
ncbi:MAG TPA: epoxide hydrolase [Gaiellaceae bacterium]|jgi:pimeloyl-ACP methyl ester carboxylesterase|nr:epoxide hydrolase [Gaiellaceae bacterium]